MSETLTLRESAAFLGLSEARMRTILAQGKIDGAEKAAVDPLSDQKVWQVPLDGLEQYQAAKGVARNGGKRKSVKVTGFTAENVGLFNAFCADHGLTVGKSYHPTDPVKAKQYRQAKRMKERAAKRAEQAEQA